MCQQIHSQYILQHFTRPQISKTFYCIKCLINCLYPQTYFCNRAVFITHMGKQFHFHNLCDIVSAITKRPMLYHKNNIFVYVSVHNFMPIISHHYSYKKKLHANEIFTHNQHFHRFLFIFPTRLSPTKTHNQSHIGKQIAPH